MYFISKELYQALMNIKILAVLSLVGTFIACSKPKTSIHALCEKGQKGGFTLKWEVYPEQDDAVMEIYASDNDSIFPQQPYKRTSVNKFIAVIEDADSLNLSFFKLKVNNTYSDIITNRFFEFDNIQNFRDLGGYKTTDGKIVKWGKLFRSGEFSDLNENDIRKIDKLKLQTTIDLRPLHSQIKRKDILNTPNRNEIYISGASNDSITKQVLEDRFLRGDATIYMQDMYEEMLIHQSNKYAQFFDYLTDEKNYPVVFHCSLGKDQSGIAAYFLLKALGVSSEIVEDDYMLSNYGVDKSKIIKDASMMSESQQEAFTMLTRTDISYLRYGLACAKKQDGSIEDFMEKRLKLTKEKRQKLRSILLY